MQSLDVYIGTLEARRCVERNEAEQQCTSHPARTRPLLPAPGFAHYVSVQSSLGDQPFASLDSFTRDMDGIVSGETRSDRIGQEFWPLKVSVCLLSTAMHESALVYLAPNHFGAPPWVFRYPGLPRCPVPVLCSKEQRHGSPLPLAHSHREREKARESIGMSETCNRHSPCLTVCDVPNTLLGLPEANEVPPAEAFLPAQPLRAPYGGSVLCFASRCAMELRSSGYCQGSPIFVMASPAYLGAQESAFIGHVLGRAHSAWKLCLIRVHLARPTLPASTSPSSVGSQDMLICNFF